MHILQPKHSKLKHDEAKKLLDELNVSLSQLPKINIDDPTLTGLNVQTGDIIKIERKEEDKEIIFYRVVV